MPSNTITVTFGGKEVILKDHRGNGWRYECGLLLFRRAISGDGGQAIYSLWESTGSELRAAGHSAQLAVSALESKLLALRDQLNKVLGTSAPADRPEEVGGKEDVK